MFTAITRAVERWAGSPVAFSVALLIVLAWAVGGLVFGFSEGWQLLINTGTTIVTFLLVFLIQSAQGRDTRAIHVKLDELLRAIGEARTGLATVEDESADEIDRRLEEFRDLVDEERKER